MAGESTTDSILILVAIFAAVLLVFCLLFTFLWQKEMHIENERSMSYRVGVLPFRNTEEVAPQSPPPHPDGAEIVVLNHNP